MAVVFLLTDTWRACEEIDYAKSEEVRRSGLDLFI